MPWGSPHIHQDLMRRLKATSRHGSHRRQPHRTAAQPLFWPRSPRRQWRKRTLHRQCQGVIAPPSKSAPPRQDGPRSASGSTSSPCRTTWLLDSTGIGRGKRAKELQKRTPESPRRQPASGPGRGGVVPSQATGCRAGWSLLPPRPGGLIIRIPVLLFVM